MAKGIQRLRKALPRLLHSGIETAEGKNLIGYEFPNVSWRPSHVKLFVEPSTGLTVRYERIVPGALDLDLSNVISTHRYDASIKIEPPKVDVNDYPPPILPAHEGVIGLPRSNAATKF